MELLDLVELPILIELSNLMILLNELLNLMELSIELSNLVELWNIFCKLLNEFSFGQDF